MDLYSNTKLTFGKYKGEYLYNVINKNIKYVYWFVSVFEGRVTESVLSILRKDNSQPIVLKSLDKEKRKEFTKKKQSEQAIERNKKLQKRAEQDKINKEKFKIREFMKNCGVYLMGDYKDGNLIYKIGHSQNVIERFSGMKTGNLNITLIGYISDNNRRQLEKDLHNQFKEFWIEREWFHGSVSILNYFLNHVDFKLINK